MCGCKSAGTLPWRPRFRGLTAIESVGECPQGARLGETACSTRNSRVCGSPESRNRHVRGDAPLEYHFNLSCGSPWCDKVSVRHPLRRTTLSPTNVLRLDRSFN